MVDSVDSQDAGAEVDGELEAELRALKGLGPEAFDAAMAVLWAAKRSLMAIDRAVKNAAEPGTVPGDSGVSADAIR